LYYIFFIGCLEKLDLVNKLFLHYGIPEISSSDIGKSDQNIKNNYDKSTSIKTNEPENIVNMNKFNDFLNKKYTTKDTTNDEDIFSYPPIPSSLLSGLDLDGDNNNTNKNNSNISNNINKSSANKSNITPAQAAIKSKLNNVKSSNHNDNPVDMDSLKDIVNMSKGNYSNINSNNNNNYRNLNGLNSMNNKQFNSDEVTYNNPKISTEKLKELEQKLLGSRSKEKINKVIPSQNKISPSISKDGNDIFSRKFGANSNYSLYDDEEDDDDEDDDDGIDFMEEVRRRLNGENDGGEDHLKDNNSKKHNGNDDSDDYNNNNNNNTNTNNIELINKMNKLNNVNSNIQEENIIDEEPEYMKYVRSIINKNDIDNSNKNDIDNANKNKYNNENSSIDLFLNSYLVENNSEDDGKVEFNRNNSYYKNNEEVEPSVHNNTTPLFVNTLSNKLSSEINKDNYDNVKQGSFVKVGVTLLSDSEDEGISNS
jgi:hypothetical protein